MGAARARALGARRRRPARSRCNNRHRTKRVNCIIKRRRKRAKEAEGRTREKESGRLHWPDVSQELRHLGSGFHFGCPVIVLTADSPMSGTSCWQAPREEVSFWQTLHFRNQNMSLLNQPSIASSYLPHPFHPWSKHRQENCPNEFYAIELPP